MEPVAPSTQKNSRTETLLRDSFVWTTTLTRNVIIKVVSTTLAEAKHGRRMMAG